METFPLPELLPKLHSRKRKGIEREREREAGGEANFHITVNASSIVGMDRSWNFIARCWFGTSSWIYNHKLKHDLVCICSRLASWLTNTNWKGNMQSQSWKVSFYISITNFKHFVHGKEFWRNMLDREKLYSKHLVIRASN